jgi:hypothetical protein
MYAFRDYVRCQVWSSKEDAYLIDDQDLPYGVRQDSLGLSFGLTKRTSDEVCWILDDNYEKSVWEWSTLRELRTFAIGEESELRQDLAVVLGYSSLACARGA